MEIEPWVFVALAATGLVSGFIDAIAGGGGLLMLPAMLSAGLPPHLALGTNKMQSSMGIFMAARTYRKAGLMEISGNWPTVFLVLFCAMAGALAVQAMDSEILLLIVPVLLVILSLYILFSPRMNDVDQYERLSARGYMPVAGAIAGYDGFFGPGTGSFLSTSIVALRGLGLTRATALAKLFNFTSNFGSLLMFALGGKVIWLLGLTIGLAAMTGSYIGSRSAIRFGAGLIRPLLAIASLAMTFRLLWGYFSA